MRLADLGGKREELVATASVFREPWVIRCGMAIADFGFLKLLTTVDSGYHEHLYDGVTKRHTKKL